MSPTPVQHRQDLAATVALSRRFDGVICFGGEDWWYHNRGHYDIRMMQELARMVPVVYVNSIGMRTPAPSEGRMFMVRVARKLASWWRGNVEVGPGLTVVTPAVLPGPHGHAITRPFMVRGVLGAARHAGITQPLVWVTCPTAAESVDALNPTAVIYQRTDRFETFDGVDAARIRRYDTWLKARADLTLFCSTWLHRHEHAQCKAASLIDHGVDTDRIIAACEARGGEPEDIAALNRPRVGFIGGIDAHTFDPHLFDAVARELPDVQFVLIGACSLPSGWTDADNVALLGRKPLEQIPAYLAACDLLIMPWNDSAWIRACNPIKLKEYIATGKPIVSTEFPELAGYRDLVEVARTPEAFARAVRDGLDKRPTAAEREERRARVAGHSWVNRSAAIVRSLADLGVEPEARFGTLACAMTAPAGTDDDAGRTPDLHDTADKASSETRRPRRRRTERTPLIADALPAAHIVLTGGLRLSPLCAATGRSVLDLWLSSDETVLDVWVRRLSELVGADSPNVPIRVVHDAIAPTPWPARDGAPPRVNRHLVTIEQEPQPFRGPAGVLRDLCRGYDDNRIVFVAEAARYVTESLHAFFMAHHEHQADITVAVNADGSPAGLYLIRTGALRLVPDMGYTDLKEQWLRRAVDTGLDTRIVTLSGLGAHPLRTRGQLIECARIVAGRPPVGGASSLVRQEEDPPFRVVCRGALVGPDATVIDSIVMPGAMIAAGATVVRSLVCPRTRVQVGADIADAVVNTEACLSDHEPYCVA